ncbi:hypothetical protein [Marimonas lutisalis]|uniref:hypothetical protein n=1 Tax=Marimonas lutisalis TaxID=2545756 RepID=UPI0010F4A730|nr:hypothetical protein [Marimonas lutisalis]
MLVALLFLGLPVAQGTPSAAEEQNFSYSRDAQKPWASVEPNFGLPLTHPNQKTETYFRKRSYDASRSGSEIILLGRFGIRTDGQVCLHLSFDETGCRVFVENRGLKFMLNEEGHRFPVTLGLRAK